MDTDEVLETLCDLAQQLDVEVRRVPLGGEGGGLCNLRGRQILFLDTLASPTEQLAQAAAALARFDQLQATYLLPAVREAIDHYKTTP